MFPYFNFQFVFNGFKSASECGGHEKSRHWLRFVSCLAGFSALGSGLYSSDAHAVQVTSLSLINADTGAVIQQLAPGSELNLATLPTKNLGVLANTDSSTVSVKFGYFNGTTTTDKYHVENSKPFCFKGDNGTRCNKFSFGLGKREIRATGYSKSRLGGTASARLNVSFTLIDVPVALGIKQLSLVDMRNGSILDSVIGEGEAIAVSDIGNRCLSVRAVEESTAVDKVVFDSNSLKEGVVTEGRTPFDLMGDLGDRGCLGTGSHTVKATAYSSTGQVLSSISRTFTISSPSQSLSPTSWSPVNKVTQYLDGVSCTIHSNYSDHAIRKSPKGTIYRYEAHQGEARGDSDKDQQRGFDRTELKHNKNFPQGTDIWVAYSMMVEPGPLPTTNWNLLGQWHPSGGGSPEFNITLNTDDNLVVQTRSGTSTSQKRVTQYYKNDFQRGKWYKIVKRIRFHANGGAVLQLWIDGVRVLNLSNFSMGYTDSLHNYWKWGVYRQVSPEVLSVQFANMEVTTSSLLDRVTNPLAITP